jgi:hypothetical protein
LPPPRTVIPPLPGSATASHGGPRVPHILYGASTESSCRPTWAPPPVPLQHPPGRLRGRRVPVRLFRDPLNWLNHCEQFFSGQQTPPADYTWLAAYHLRGAAQTWYFTLVQDEGRPSWARFKELCHLQFGPPVRGSRLAELGRIQFHSTVQAVLCHARNLDSSQKADLYVGGLPDHIRVDVELRAPHDLPMAVYLARSFELRARSLLAQRPPETSRFSRQSRPVQASRPPLPPPVPPTAGAPLPGAQQPIRQFHGVVKGYAITVIKWFSLLLL